MKKEIEKLTSAGLYLVAIPPINGLPSKAPVVSGWNKPRAANNPNGYSNNPNDFTGMENCNFGLIHAPSKTVAFDIDNLEATVKIFEDVAGHNIPAWLSHGEAVVIKSPKLNRGKMLFKLPDNFDESTLNTKKYSAHSQTVFELRCGNCQDIIIGEHPEGGDYQLIGNIAEIPPVPKLLIDMLLNWGDWRICFDDAMDIPLPTFGGVNQARGFSTNLLKGQFDPIAEFNRLHSIEEILLRNGYRQVGKRFIRPNSESKVPGVSIMANCGDGRTRVFSHGGDALNNGSALDSFDVFRILECGGNLKVALAWNAELTRHNQRIWRQANSPFANLLVSGKKIAESANG